LEFRDHPALIPDLHSDSADCDEHEEESDEKARSERNVMRRGTHEACVHEAHPEEKQAHEYGERLVQITPPL
jgi:hypothetical protein